MRLTTLLLILVAVLLLTAPAASFAQTSKTSKFGDLFSGDAAAVIHPDGSSPATDRTPSHWKFDTLNSQAVCLTMRTYVVARDTPNSDATHAVGYHECLPAWKFDIRTSDEKARGKR